MSADIGKSIKQIREQRDLNQRELAKYAGISNVTVCKIGAVKKVPKKKGCNLAKKQDSSLFLWYN